MAHPDRAAGHFADDTFEAVGLLFDVDVLVRPRLGPEIGEDVAFGGEDTERHQLRLPLEHADKSVKLAHRLVAIENESGRADHGAQPSQVGVPVNLNPRPAL